MTLASDILARYELYISDIKGKYDPYIIEAKTILFALTPGETLRSVLKKRRDARRTQKIAYLDAFQDFIEMDLLLDTPIKADLEKKRLSKEQIDERVAIYIESFFKDSKFKPHLLSQLGRLVHFCFRDEFNLIEFINQTTTNISRQKVLVSNYMKFAEWWKSENHKPDLPEDIFLIFPQQTKELLTQRDIDLFFNAPPIEQSVLYLLFICDLRFGEVASLKRSDFNGKSIRVDGKSKELPLQFGGSISEYLKQNYIRPKEPLFPNHSKRDFEIITKRARLRAKIKDELNSDDLRALLSGSLKNN